MSALAYRHQRVQRLRRLMGRRNARKEEGRFVIEGVNLLEEALAAGTPIEAVFVDSQWDASAGPRVGPGTGMTSGEQPPRAQAAPSPEPPAGASTGARLRSALERCFRAGARVFELEAGVIEKVAGTVTPQPVMAVVQMPDLTLAGLGEKRPKLLVVCVNVRDPGNAGTVVRSAWAAGADAVVCCEGTVDPWNPKSVRSSAGAVLNLPVVTAGPASKVLDEIKTWGLWRWGAVPGAGVCYYDADLAQPCAMVFGNEAGGLPIEELAGHLDGLLSIPMSSGAESLNVGMAAAVVCFEAARQRRRPSAQPGGAAVQTGNAK